VSHELLKIVLIHLFSYCENWILLHSPLALGFSRRFGKSRNREHISANIWLTRNAFLQPSHSVIFWRSITTMIVITAECRSFTSFPFLYGEAQKRVKSEKGAAKRITAVSKLKSTVCRYTQTLHKRRAF
jgi:hypothetical protein